MGGSASHMPLLPPISFLPPPFIPTLYFFLPLLPQKKNKKEESFDTSTFRALGIVAGYLPRSAPSATKSKIIFRFVAGCGRIGAEPATEISCHFCPKALSDTPIKRSRPDFSCPTCHICPISERRSAPWIFLPNLPHLPQGPPPVEKAWLPTCLFLPLLPRRRSFRRPSDPSPSRGYQAEGMRAAPERGCRHD